ncbi:MAG: glycerophosphodiester phosphodiesterase family protein [Caldilineales bacterium]
MNAGGHFGPQYADEPIPTLDEAIDCLPGDCFLNIEAKRKKLVSDGLEAGIVAAVRHHNLYDRVIVSSFNPVALMRIGLKDRRIPLGLLWETGMPFLMDTGWPSTFLRRAALHPSWDIVTLEFVQKAHADGRRVFTWTVNEPEHMRRMIDAGVDGIITDRPDLLARLFTNGSAHNERA